ncbi:MAG: hypothetical protein RDV48_22700 [Candidatus Eremiobacteraeota bacterium]|nr:hypothetical protein [Candidatus Eremiobacteraeota bacterium]
MAADSLKTRQVGTIEETDRETVQKAYQIGTIRGALQNKGEAFMNAPPSGFPPRITAGDRMLIRKQRIEQYKAGDFVVFEIDGAPVLGKIDRVNVSAAGLSVRVTMAPPVSEKKEVVQNRLMGRIVSLERDGQTIAMPVGIVGDLMAIFGK